MSRYNYIAKTKSGGTVRGEEESSSREEVVSRLRAKGLFIVSINERRIGRRSSGNQKIRHKRNSVKLYDLTFFSRNLATTLSSGVTLLRSLEIISHQTESLKLEKILKSCFQDIKNGLSLAESIAKYPSVFTNLWMGIIKVGETSGNLPFVLDKLADYLEMKMEFERKITSALIYPSILFFAAVLAIFIFLRFIFPQFNTLFFQFNVELPPLTKLLFNISNFLKDNSLILFGGLILLGIAGISLKDHPSVKRAWSVVSLKLPILNEVFFLIYLERIASTIYILLDGGLPLVYTLEITAQCIDNLVLKEKLIAVERKVKDGSPLSREFNNQGVFPLLVSEMTKIGEETGSLPAIFEKISSHYRKDLATKVERLVAAFEPLMIIVMGIIIGGIVISLFLPIFKISSMK